MQHDQPTAAGMAPTQFSLAALFEFMTVCAVPLAFSRTIGFASSLMLMAMGLALGFRRGWLALAALTAASVAADFPAAPLAPEGSLYRQIMVGGLAAALCCWYAVRRRGAITAQPPADVAA